MSCFFFFFCFKVENNSNASCIPVFELLSYGRKISQENLTQFNIKREMHYSSATTDKRLYLAIKGLGK